MVYVISDIHGMYEKYMAMLDRIALSDKDKLYVLGDCMDRGENGIKVMQDVMNRENVMTIMGNHEDLAIPILRTVIWPELEDDNFRDDLDLWCMNGGGSTLEHFMDDLTSDEQKKMYEFIIHMPLYKRIEVNGYTFIMSHTLPEAEGYVNFESLTKEDLIWGRQNYSNRYVKDIKTCFITGHTPTALIDKRYLGKIFMSAGNVAVDCGACFSDAGGRLGCLCLDTMDEYYI